jgi:hypothetical protein
MLREHGSYINQTPRCSMVTEYTQEETLTLHTWLLQKIPSVGEDGESVTTSSIHTKGHLG